MRSSDLLTRHGDPLAQDQAIVRDALALCVHGWQPPRLRPVHPDRHLVLARLDPSQAQLDAVDKDLLSRPECGRIRPATRHRILLGDDRPVAWPEEVHKDLEVGAHRLQRLPVQLERQLLPIGSPVVAQQPSGRQR